VKHNKPSKQQTPTTWEVKPLNWNIEPLPAWDLALPEHLFTGLPHWDEAQLPPWGDPIEWNVEPIQWPND
jgi:hypothetical protein